MRFIMENPINMNDLGVSLCLETPIYTQQTTRVQTFCQVTQGSKDEQTPTSRGFNEVQGWEGEDHVDGIG